MTREGQNFNPLGDVGQAPALASKPASSPRPRANKCRCVTHPIPSPVFVPTGVAVHAELHTVSIGTPFNVTISCSLSPSSPSFIQVSTCLLAYHPSPSFSPFHLTFFPPPHCFRSRVPRGSCCRPPHPLLLTPFSAFLTEVGLVLSNLRTCILYKQLHPPCRGAAIKFKLKFLLSFLRASLSFDRLAINRARVLLFAFCIHRFVSFRSVSVPASFSLHSRQVRASSYPALLMFPAGSSSLGISIPPLLSDLLDSLLPVAFTGLALSLPTRVL